MPADCVPLGKQSLGYGSRADLETAAGFAIRPWNEPFCTVLPKQMGDAVDVSREQLPAKPDGLPS